MTHSLISGACLSDAAKVTPGGKESYDLAAGLFDGRAGFALRKEIDVDRKPPGIAIVGDHDRKTQEEIEATFASYGEGKAK